MTAEASVAVRAESHRVWRALVDETSRWWREGFFALAESRGMRIEPILGGRMYEWADDGSAVVWFTVIGVQPGRSLDLAGHLTPAFGGPATAMLRLEVTPDGAGSLVKVTESRVGCIASDAVASTQKAWQILLDGLRNHVEG
jgi:hypothetical protein